MSLSNSDIQRLLLATGRYQGKVDGDIGPKSSAAIQTTLYAVTDDLPLGWDAFPISRKAVLAAQVTLKALGFDPSPLDGFNGMLTQEAFTSWAYEQRHGVKPKEWRPDDQWGTQKEVEKVFGKAGGAQCTAGVVQLPFPMRLAWYTSKKIKTFNCHELVAASAQRAYERIASSYSQKDIPKHGFDLFGGCFNYRKKRGGATLSMHAYGVAIDHDPERNQLKWGRDRAYLAQDVCKPFWDAWEAEGWTSLGKANNFDWMHVQAPKV